MTLERELPGLDAELAYRRELLMAAGRRPRPAGRLRRRLRRTA